MRTVQGRDLHGSIADSCLMVTGSKGHGGQLLKTDQDNGLLLRDRFEAPAELLPVARVAAVVECFGR